MSGCVSLRSFARWSDERMQLRVVPPVRTTDTLWRRSTERGFCGCLLPSIRGCPLARTRLGGEACDSLPPEAGEAACDSESDLLPQAGEEACDSESDSLPPHSDDATPHHERLQASKHRTELRRRTRSR